MSFDGMTAQEVIPGDAGALSALGAQLCSLSSGLDEAARTLAQIETGEWQGQAADAFRGVIHQQPNEYSSAASSFWAAGKAIQTYAGELSAAQGQAGRALGEWNAAQSATRTWHSQSLKITAKTLGGHDPGAAGRASATGSIHAAHAQLDAAATSLRSTLAQASHAAPRAPKGLERLFHDLEAVSRVVFGGGAASVGAGTARHEPIWYEAGDDISTVLGLVPNLPVIGQLVAPIDDQAKFFHHLETHDYADARWDAGHFALDTALVIAGIAAAGSTAVIAGVPVATAAVVGAAAVGAFTLGWHIGSAIGEGRFVSDVRGDERVVASGVHWAEREASHLWQGLF